MPFNNSQPLNNDGQTIADDFSRPYVILLVTLVLFTLIFSLIPTLIIHHQSGSYWPTDYFRMDRKGGDFLCSYAAGKAILDGKSIYAPDFADPYGRGFSYPPLHALVLVPLSLLSSDQAYYTWVGISIVLLLLSGILAARLYRSPWVTFLFGFLIYAQSSFIHFQFERGQTDALVVVLLTLFLFSYIRRWHSFWPALFLSLAALVKVFPAVLGLMLLLRKEFKILFIAAFLSIGIILSTGLSDWITYVQQVIPSYANYYLGSTVEHSLFYFVEAVVREHSSARRIAKMISILLISLYTILVFFNKEKRRYILIDSVIILTIAEIATPWAANYKLIVLLFFFLSPLALLEVPGIRKKPVLGTLPLFIAFLLIVCPVGDQLTRLPFSLYVNLSGADLFTANALHPFLTERKVACGILLGLTYLFCVYSFITLSQYKGGIQVLKRIDVILRPKVLMSLASSAVMLLCVVVIVKQHQHRPPFRELIKNSTHSYSMGSESDLIAYRATPRPNTFTQLDLVFRVKKPLPENMMMYIHAFKRDEKGEIVVQGGANFYPDIFTNLWPPGKDIVVQEVINPSFTGFKVGFYHPTLGYRHAEEVVVDMAPIN